MCLTPKASTAEVTMWGSICTIWGGRPRPEGRSAPRRRKPNSRAQGHDLPGVLYRPRMAMATAMWRAASGHVAHEHVPLIPRTVGAARINGSAADMSTPPVPRWQMNPTGPWWPRRWFSPHHVRRRRPKRVLKTIHPDHCGDHHKTDGLLEQRMGPMTGMRGKRVQGWWRWRGYHRGWSPCCSR